MIGAAPRAGRHFMRAERSARIGRGHREGRMGSTEKDRTQEATSACLRDGLERHESTVALLRGEPLRSLAMLVDTLHRTLEAGGKVLACGNGGSAADAQH